MSKQADNNYEVMVEKARTYFWNNGYQEVSIKDLADHLEVSQSVIYKKYTKEMLLVASLDSYVNTLSNPILSQIKNSTEGMKTFKEFFYGLVDALLTKTFPRSCLMVNTVVEMHDEQERLNLTDVYNRYFGNMHDTYLAILKRAAEKGELKHPEKINKYADFLVGIVFGISILYKVKSKEELQQYIDQQLALIS